MDGERSYKENTLYITIFLMKKHEIFLNNSRKFKFSEKILN